MRKLFAISAVVLFITAFSPVGVAAKPAYCLTALIRCYEACAQHYSTDFYRSLCDAGCLIGYASCGS